MKMVIEVPNGIRVVINDDSNPRLVEMFIQAFKRLNNK